MTETLGSVVGWRGEKGISVFVRSSSLTFFNQRRLHGDECLIRRERNRKQQSLMEFWKIFVENMSTRYPCTRGTGSSDVYLLKSQK